MLETESKPGEVTITKAIPMDCVLMSVQDANGDSQYFVRMTSLPGDQMMWLTGKLGPEWIKLDSEESERYENLLWPKLDEYMSKEIERINSGVSVGQARNMIDDIETELKKVFGK